MASDWFIKINNAEHGPLTSEKLRHLAQQGKVTPETPLKSGVAGHWLPAIQLRGLFPETDSHSTPATAKPQTAAPSPASRPPDVLKAPRPSARSSPGEAAVAKSSPASKANSSSSCWYLCEEGKTFGPYTDAELKQMAREATISPAAQVKAGEHGSLMPASQVPGIDFRPAQKAATPKFVSRAKPKPTPKPSHYTPHYKSNSKVLVAVVVTILLVAGGSAYYFFFRGGGRTEVATQQPSVAANASVPRPQLPQSANGLPTQSPTPTAAEGAVQVPPTSPTDTRYQNLQPTIKAMLVSIKKLKIKAEMGINYPTYESAVGDAYPDAKVFIESAEAKDLPELAFLLSNACDSYLKVRNIWHTDIYKGGTFDESMHAWELMHYAPDLLWKAAGLNLDLAEQLVNGSPENRTTVLELLADKAKAEKLTMQYNLNLAEAAVSENNRQIREENERKRKAGR